MRPDESAEAQDLSDLWDAVVKDAQPPTNVRGEHGDLIRHLLHHDTRPHADATFVTRLETQLQANTRQGTRVSTAPERATSMQTIPNSKPIRFSLNRGRRFLPAVPSWFSTVTMLVVVLMLIGATFGGDVGRFVDREDEPRQLAALDPTDEASPQATPESEPFVGDGTGGTYLGTAARDGRNPGPGPVGNAYQIWDHPWNGPPGIVTAEDNLFVLTGGWDQTTRTLDCVKLSDGSSCWSQPVVFEGESAVSDPTVVDKRIFVTRTDGVYAFSTLTGKQLWFQPLLIGEIQISPAVAEGKVVVVSRTGNGNNLLAMDASSGMVIWTQSAPVEPLGIISSHAPLAITNSRIFLRTSNGYALAYDLETGNLLWERSLGNPVGFLTGDNGPMLISAGVAYLSAVIDDGNEGTPNEVKLFAIDEATGEDVWSPMDVPGMGFLTADDINLYYAPYTERSTTLIAIDRDSGQIQWQHKGVGKWKPPVIAGDRIYVSEYNDGNIRGLNKETGQPVWNVYVADSTSFIVANDMLVVGLKDRVVAIGGDRAKAIAEQPTDLSGFPSCIEPRSLPIKEVNGKPTLTLDVTSANFDRTFSAYDANGDPTDSFSDPYPQVLTDYAPPPEQVEETSASNLFNAVAAYNNCLLHPEFRLNTAGFFSDDFFRRGYLEYDPERGYVVPPATENFSGQNILLGKLHDGRYAARVDLADGYGELFIFVEIDGQWLIDEYYHIVPSYDDGSNG